MSQVVAFYGFKGGSGRSQILANIACVMAADGKRVLVIDLDLEAPGVGDYFHQSAPTVFADSRARRGILDLLIDREYQISKEMLVTVPIPGKDTSGSIHILGPGSHVTEGAFPQAYPQRVTSFDWGIFFDDVHGNFLRQFGDILKNHSDFDFILIDARTGYNLASIMLLQHWTTDVVGVGTTSMQSLDGLARMMPSFEAAGLRCHLVISKYPFDSGKSEIEDAELTYKDRLIQAYHPTLPALAYKFTFLKELTRGDSNLWERHSKTFWESLLTSSAASKDQPLSPQEIQLRDYCQTTVNLYKALSETPTDISPVQVTNVWAPSTELKFAFNQSGSNRLILPQIEDRIESFLQRVREYCDPLPVSDEPVTAPTFQDAPDSTPRRPEASVPVLANYLSELPLEAREYARLRVATVLAELEKQDQSGDEERTQRRKTVRQNNALAIIPIAQGLITEEPPVHQEKHPAQEQEYSVKEETKPTGGMPLSLAQQMLHRRVWTAFGAIIRNPGSGENQQLINDAYSHAEGIGLTMRQASALHLAGRVQDCYQAETASVDNIRTLGNALREALDGRGLDLPQNADIGFSNWNALDAWPPYVIKATQPGPLATLDQQVEDLCGRVISLLTASKAQPEDASYFRAYLNISLLAKRRLLHLKERGRPPHSLSSLLTREEKHRLLLVSGAGSLDAASFKTVADVHRAVLGIELELYGGDPSAAIRGLKQLMAALAKPQHPLATEQRADWCSLLRALSALSYDLREEGLSTWFARLALRAYWPGRATQGRDEFVAICAADLALANGRIGISLSEDTVAELQKTSSWSPEALRWWPVTNSVVCGDYRKASEALEQELSGAEVPDSVFGWVQECAVRMADLPLAERTFQQWLDHAVIRNAHHDAQWTWLNMRGAYSLALLAQGDTEKADEILRDALQVVATRSDSIGRGLNSMLEVRRTLLNTILGKRDPKSAAAVAARYIEDYKIHVRSVQADGCCDREFAEYLGITWDDATFGLGMFSGYDAPSRERQRLAETLVEFAEILYRVDEREQAREVAAEILERVLSRYDEADSKHFLAPRRLAYCYSIAASCAFLGLRNQAVRHRDADCHANGPGGDAFYQRIFRLVGWQVNPWTEPERPLGV